MHYVTRMYLGRQIPKGASPAFPYQPGFEIGDTAFDKFVEDVVATTFPDGFTLIDTHGGWRDTTNGVTIRERSTILEVYHSGSTLIRRKIKDVAVTYRQRFGQDAVMVSTLNLTEGVEFI